MCRLYVERGNFKALDMYLLTLLYQIWVPMILNPNGIEPTFLKLDSWSPGAGFIPIIISNVLN